MPWCCTLAISEIVLRIGTPVFLLRGTGTDTFNSLQTYGANVDQVKAQIGSAVSQDEVEKALQAKKYKIITVTHVDTSTGSPSAQCFIVQTDLFPSRCAVGRESYC